MWSLYSNCLPLLLLDATQVNGAPSIVDPARPLQLYGGEGNSAFISYTWNSTNTTLAACFRTSGPYLTVRSGCLLSGGTYAFRVAVETLEGRKGARQVRGVC
jgi:hypothetical protein